MTDASAQWSPWRAVVVFGLVSLAADMVYEGMRSASGPFLGSLGASAVTVGIVTGAGEAIAQALRLATGPLADRTGRYWSATFAGYALTALAVPLLALAPFVGAAGLGLASVLVLVERTGKAVRSPSKSTLLAQWALPVGRGRGFAVHKALDQVGAFAGPLLVAGLAALTGRLWPGFLALAIPGAASLMILVWLRRHVGGDDPSPPDADTAEPVGRQRLSGRFFAFAASTALSTLGLMTFGVMSYHLVDADLMSVAAVPVLYAGAMAVEAVAALATGFTYDRASAWVLVVVPPVVALVPVLVFTGSVVVVCLGVALWALGTGVQDSTVKALVAELVPRGRLATAYGVFAAAQGVAALAGGALAGALYRHHLTGLVVVLAIAQVIALALLVVTLRRTSQPTPEVLSRDLG